MLWACERYFHGNRVVAFGAKPVASYVFTSNSASTMSSS